MDGPFDSELWRKLQQKITPILLYLILFYRYLVKGNKENE